jgi:hypothetical protein
MMQSLGLRNHLERTLTCLTDAWNQLFSSSGRVEGRHNEVSSCVGPRSSRRLDRYLVSDESPLNWAAFRAKGPARAAPKARTSLTAGSLKTRRSSQTCANLSTSPPSGPALELAWRPQYCWRPKLAARPATASETSPVVPGDVLRKRAQNVGEATGDVLKGKLTRREEEGSEP